ncbi:isoprenylcysteine carboxyl methyltransferase family protein [Streptococcus ictaluri]|uniref:Isoprenylcysteine carboxyl methyltransferase family protein n=1 Tax=Streptococcus ictaluri 707-05 TaxID=764299 RepID=G5K0B2_9STRE|nr:isoprenylcysteine carboxyl methyltransferase family protein [Streptococcus ictaluri]EHI70606.1 isoprenylcysteine carboxyl methyltransferase family protein [Streptococcus ictaluri 707-05]
MSYPLLIVVAVFILRLYFLKISKRNEARIRQEGGQEFGVENTKRLTILHILFYLGCFVEAFLGQVHLDTISLVGLMLLVFSMIMLRIVVSLLEGIWTVKLMVAVNHPFNTHWLFEKVKHPNYYLNIIPELLGLSLLCHAWVTLIFVSPLYLYTLYVRIKEENSVLETIIRPNHNRLAEEG